MITQVIFDIDGTLADCEHRKHWIQNKPKNWNAFFNEMVYDRPIEATVNLAMMFSNFGHTVILCSGRPENYRNATEYWLNLNQIYYNKLYMRKAGDFRADNIVKDELYQQMLADGYNPRIVFDDRKQVIDMWISKGLFVFDVSQGKGDF